MNLHIESNPAVLTKGDLVLFKSNGKNILRVGFVIQGYNDGKENDGKKFRVEEIITKKIYFPYTQNTILVNEGILIKGIKSQLILTDIL